MAEGAATAAERRRRGRRQKRRQEFDAQTRLTKLLAKHLPDTVFWSGVENKPRSRLGGLFQRQRGVKSGLPDVVVIANGQATYIEMKSRRGVASKRQRQIREQLLAAGATWFLARTPRAALAALALANVPFKREWRPGRIEPWEGPTTAERLPPSPELVVEGRQAVRRWRERQRLKAAVQAVERDDGAGAWAASEAAPA
jgi:hypothetical protein